MSNATALFRLLQRKPRRTDLELTDFGVLGLTWAPETLRANARDRLISRMYLDMGRIPTTLEEQAAVRAVAESQIDLIIERGRQHRAETGTAPVLPESMAMYAGGKVSPLDVPHINVPAKAPAIAEEPIKAAAPDSPVALGLAVAESDPEEAQAAGPAALEVVQPYILASMVPTPPANGLPPEGSMPEVLERAPPEGLTGWAPGPAIPFERIWWGRWPMALVLLAVGMLF